MKRIYILDGHGYVFRAYFALMTGGRGDRRDVRLSRADGMPTGALYIFSRMLMRLHEEVNPAHVVVVFDAGSKSFRNDMYPEYKANRPEAPEDLEIQFPFFRRVVEAMHWPVLEVPGVEADDVIATLAVQAKAQGWAATVYSADKDLMQLVGDGIEMVDSLNNKRYEPADVEAKFGVPPAQVADYLALVGDTADNIPGMAGVGAKTAATLLGTYGSIDAMIAANPVVPRLKVKQPFGDAEVVARLKLSRALVELKTDVPVEKNFEAFAVAPWQARDVSKLTALFRELEFTGMATRVEQAATAPAAPVAGDSAAPTATGTATEPVTHTSVASAFAIARDGDTALAELCAGATAAGSVACIIETTKERSDRCTMVGIALATAAGPAVYVPIAHYYLGAPSALSAATLAPLRALFANPSVSKLTYDAKLARQVLLRAGYDVAGTIDDLMLMAFLAASDVPAPSVEALARDLAHTQVAPRGEAMGKSNDSFAAVDVASAAAHVGAVARALPAAAAALRPTLDAHALMPLYRDMELPTCELLAVMEMRGVAIDAAHFAAMSQRIAQTIAELQASVFNDVGGEFNLGSPKQLGHILFDTLGLPTAGVRKTKTGGYSTDHEVLEQLADTHPAVSKILKHRELLKLKGTYLDALPPLVHPVTGRLHTNYHQAVAATGRLSSQDPNLQNIPIRTEEGREIRRGFVGGPGKVLVAADYSQIELRILAHLSQDAMLIKAFGEGIDIHTQTAALVFGMPPAKVTSHERRVAKAVNYGLMYGQSDFGLARALDIPRRQAKEYSDKYFQTFPTIREFMQTVVDQARRDGGITTIFGRWRPIPNLDSKNIPARKAAERIAQNTPMQGAGADIIKLAMIACERRIAQGKLPAAMILSVHDELVFEVEPKHADAVAAAMKHEMEGVAKLSVPLEVEVGIAANWADA
ncbi:MAG: DNA polymerase I [Myxococcales bacterium]|nr:DNA polymerase I [Myxococcales bacterium]